MRRVRVVEGLRIERGLHLVRYGGGDDMREASSLLHYSQTIERCASKHQFEVTAAVESSLKSRTEEEEDAIGRVNAKEINWRGASWEAAVHVSYPHFVAGEQNRKATRACLFHQGWLHEDAAEQGNYGAQSYPMISVWDADEESCIVYDRGDGDLLGEGSSAPVGKSFRAADQHIHKVDCLGGGTVEQFISTLMQTGMSAEDAAVFAQIEMSAADEYYMGADMARIQLQTNSVTNSSAVVICVDLQDPRKPRVLVTLLVVVTTSRLESQVKQVAVELSKSKSVPFENVVKKLAECLPNFGAVDSSSTRTLQTFRSFLNATNTVEPATTNDRLTRRLKRVLMQQLSDLQCKNKRLKSANNSRRNQCQNQLE